MVGELPLDSTPPVGEGAMKSAVTAPRPEPAPSQLPRDDAAPPRLSLLEDPSQASDPGRLSDPTTASDLGLLQLVEEVASSHEEWDLHPLFLTRATSTATIRYRQAVFRDLEDGRVATALTSFCAAMSDCRELLAQSQGGHHQPQQAAWFLASATTYFGAVQDLADGLQGLDIRSSGLRRCRSFLQELTRSAAFIESAQAAAEVRAQLEQVEYVVEILGARVTVRRFTGEADYGAELQSTFARFRSGASRSHLFQLGVAPQLSGVEERILDLVARLCPQAFAALYAFQARHHNFTDPTVLEIDRQLHFYLAYRDWIQPLRQLGLDFCYPEVEAGTTSERAVGAFDLSLAAQLAKRGLSVVTNDFELVGDERLLIVSGPNQGGKTTFARSFGQIHHLAALGCPVPGRRATLRLCDELLTHFERQERLEDLRGRLEDDLVRMADIMERATAHSVVILNETFSSASLEDGRRLGRAVIEGLVARGVVGVYVTFIDELASIGPGTVSMVSQVDPQDPAVRTFRLLRQPANGIVHALVLAERHGLTYPQLRRSLRC